MRQDNKINILIAPSDRYGVGAFRSVWPAQCLDKNHSDEFHVEINHEPNVKDIEYLKQFDVVHFHRQFGPNELEDETFDTLKKLGIITVMDLDDYWLPFSEHPLFLLIQKEGYPERIKKTLSKVDYVTTTTELFADEIRKINPNVFVIPNAINPEEKMWQHVNTKREDDERCRISWIGGSSHAPDLRLMEHSFIMLYNNQELRDKFQIQLCGFDTRGTLTTIDEFGKQTQRPITPHETIWYNTFEKYFTNNYNGLSDSPEYVEWLKKVIKGSYDDEYNQRYVRRWTKPLTSYAMHYDHCDIVLAPLDEWDMITTEKGQKIRQVNMFNKVKSELKIIEAGMKKKALIAQDFGIYKELLEHDETALLVSKNDKGWYQAMRRMILEPGLKERLAENLHNFVKDKYDIKNVTKDRVSIYKQILEEAQKEKAIII